MHAPANVESAVRPLASLSPGERGQIRGILGLGDLRHRLLEMGLTRGTMVELVRVAPLGDPLELRIRGYRLSLRKSEAATILVEST